MSAYQQNQDLEKDLLSYEFDNHSLDTSMQSLEGMITTMDMVGDSPAGLDPTAYELATHSIECFAKLGRIGLAMPTMSIERFKEDKFVIGEPSMEGIVSGIKNVFMSIINAISASFKWIAGFIKRLFSRSKEIDEKLDKMEDQAAEIKKEVAEMSDADRNGGIAPRTSEGWFMEVKVHNPSILTHLVYSGGLMDQAYMHKLSEELKKVADAQTFHVQRAIKNLESAQRGQMIDEAGDFKMEMAETKDQEILKQLNPPTGATVYASLEFGAGEFITVVKPKLDPVEAKNERDVHKASTKWAQEIRISRVSTGKSQDVNKFAVLKGDWANADHLINAGKEMVKQWNWFNDRIIPLQKAKERFMKEFEAEIKKQGAGLFSSNDKKAVRDDMLFRLKFFQKTMDQPALMYFAQCDKLLNALIHLGTYVLHYNRSKGNHVELKKEEAASGA